MEMKELVRRIVEALVDCPEEVDVQKVGGSNTKLLEVRVAKTDLGKLIGKRGKNITALRSIIWAAAKGERYMVDVIGDESPGPRRLSRGRVTRLFEDRGYGFIDADDGRTIYFHASSLKGLEFRSLSLDQQVEFRVEQDSSRPRAVSVDPLTGGRS
jgi:hypothetical protein